MPDYSNSVMFIFCRRFAHVVLSRLKHQRFLRTSQKELKKLVIKDKKQFALDIALQAPNLTFADIWQHIRPLRSGHSRGVPSRIRPAPMMFDKQGRPVTDAEGLAQVWFQRACAIDSYSKIRVRKGGRSRAKVQQEKTSLVVCA